MVFVIITAGKGTRATGKTEIMAKKERFSLGEIRRIFNYLRPDEELSCI